MSEPSERPEGDGGTTPPFLQAGERTPSQSRSRQPFPVIDTRRYRWMIGAFGLLLAATVGIALLLSRGFTPIGVPAGQHLRVFVAPLARSGVDLDANTAPRCDRAHPNPQGLNVCGRTPLVLDFFAPDSGSCKRQVDTLQAVSREFRAGNVQFGAVAIRADRAATAALVRSHHWTIDVAYDRDGSVGALYHVEICPLLEVAARGGVVLGRLTGDRWVSRAALSARVRELLG